MSEYYNREGMYMMDNEAFIMAKFDPISNALEYTLDLACNENRSSIFAQVHEVSVIDRETNSFEINIDPNHLFYAPLLSFLGEEQKISFVDERIKSKKVHIALEKDNTISLFFDLPENRFNTTNIHISREDENFLRFQQLIALIESTLAQYTQGRQI